MIRKYDKTHKNLSLIAAVVLLTLGLYLSLTAFNSALSSVLLRGRFAFDDLLSGMTFLLIPLYCLSYSGIVYALLTRKKNILAAIAFVIPLVLTILPLPLICLLIAQGDIIESLLWTFQIGGILLMPGFFAVAIVVSCITKGKIFGEKAAVVLLILAALAFFSVITAPISITFTESISQSIRYDNELTILDLLEELVSASSTFGVFWVLAMPIPPIALAYFLPNKEAEAAPEETEEEEGDA